LVISFQSPQRILFEKNAKRCIYYAKIPRIGYFFAKKKIVTYSVKTGYSNNGLNGIKLLEDQSFAFNRDYLFKYIKIFRYVLIKSAFFNKK
jgi:hypothetical protein